MNRPNNAFQREGKMNVSFLLAGCVIWCVAVWLCCALSLPFFFIPPCMLEPETSSSRYQNPLTGNGVRRRNENWKKEFVMLYAHFSQHKYLIDFIMLWMELERREKYAVLHMKPSALAFTHSPTFMNMNKYTTAHSTYLYRKANSFLIQ